MRILLGLIAMGLVLVESGDATKPAGVPGVVTPAVAATASSPKAHVDFDSQVKPILKSKCMPCHFSGGKMYDRLPFDKPETIRKLGTKMFTRITQHDERRLIEDFLTQTP